MIDEYKLYMNENNEMDEVPRVKGKDMRTSNGSLDTAKWFFGKEMNGSLEAEHDLAAKIMVLRLKNGHKLSVGHKSHDNYTGIVALARYHGVYFTDIDWDHERSYHPRAQAYFSWAKDYSIWDYPGLMFANLASVYTCWKSTKERNGVDMVKTSNELMLILMFRAGLKDIWFCRCFGPLYDYLLKRRFGPAYLKEMQDLRHPHAENHPVKVEWRKIPVGFKWWR